MYNQKIKSQILAKRNMARFEHRLMDFCSSSNALSELFYDQFSGLFFKSTTASILAAELAINRELSSSLECPVSMFYDMLGIDFQTLMLDQKYTWYIDDETYWVDFDHIYIDSDIQHPPYHLIAMIPEPTFERSDIGHVI